MKTEILNCKMASMLVIILLVCSGLLISLSLTPMTFITKGSSAWTQTTYNDFDNGTLINTTIMGSGKDAQVCLDLTELNEWSQKSPSSSPSARYLHSMASIYGTKKVLLFGGYDGSYNDETWVYDLSANTWNNKNPQGSKPSARYQHAMASIYGDDKVLLFGGYDGSYDDETWVYDLSENSWSLKAYGPYMRQQHAMSPIYGDDKVLLFGGYRSGTRSDTWVYDLSENSWSQKVNGPGRYDHAMASVFNDDKVVLFGGRYNYDETWVFDLSLNTWTEKYPSPRPNGREDHAMATIYGTDNVLLYGGSNGGDETWVYDLNAGTEGTWKQKTPSIKPNYRRDHAMAGVYNTDKVVFFGGYYNVQQSDTWVYKHFLATKNGTFLSSSHDTGSESAFQTISWNSYKPSDTTIRLQLRTAADLSILSTKNFVGPEGKKSAYYTTTGESIWTGHDNDRWVQVKVFLNINIITESPIIEDITIAYNCLPKTIAVAPSNGSIITINNPVFVWTFEDHDSEQQSAFQVLIDNDNAFESIDYDSNEQITTENQWQFPAGTSYTTLPDGTWHWKMRTKDFDGTWSKYTSSFKLIIDTQAPSSATIMPANNGIYNCLNTLSGISTDGTVGSGVNKIEIAIKRSRDNYYWDGEIWSPLENWLLVAGTTNWNYDSSTVKWTSGDQYLIRTRAVDDGNNLEVPSVGNKFKIDMDSPLSFIDTPINDTWLNNLDAILGSCMDIGDSGIDRVEISIKSMRDHNYWYGAAWKLGERWLNTSGKDQWFFDTSNIQWSTGDTYIIRSRGMDITGNLECPGAERNFMFDDQPPEHLSILINNGAEYSNSPETTLSLHSEDLGSGIYQMSFSTDGAFWTDWEPYSTTKPYNLTGVDGEKFIHFKVQDFAGNIAEPVIATIVLDTTPPEEQSIGINNNSQYINSPVVTLSLSATDSLSGISAMAFSTNDITWTPWELFNPTKFLIVPSGDGEKIIYFKVKDRAENVAIVTNIIILDTIPPHSLSIMIDNGASETHSSSVSLTINAIDDGSGVGKISFSIDGKNWCAWKNYTHTNSFNLPSGEGKKDIYFKVKDHAGNTADPISASIYLKASSVTVSPMAGELSSIVLIVIILILIIIIIILIIFGLVVKRKRDTDQHKYSPNAIVTRTTGGRSRPYQPESISADMITDRHAAAAFGTQVGASQSTPVTLQRQIPHITDFPQLPPAAHTQGSPPVPGPTVSGSGTTGPQVTTPTPSVQPSQVQPTQQVEKPSQTAQTPNLTASSTQPSQNSPQPPSSSPPNSPPSSPASSPPGSPPAPEHTPTPSTAQNPAQSPAPSVHLPGSTPKKQPSLNNQNN